jgi:hypothetical protein
MPLSPDVGLTVLYASRTLTGMIGEEKEYYMFRDYLLVTVHFRGQNLKLILSSGKTI